MSNNQGFREATFIQMGRSGREARRVEWQGDAVWHGGGVAAAMAAEWTAPHSCVVDLIWEGYLGNT